jgi:hypothetical protein
MLTQARRLRDDGDINVAYGPPVLRQLTDYGLQQHSAIRASKLLICVGEMSANIAEPGGPQQCVTYRVQHHITV